MAQTKQYFGKYVGQIMDVADPEKKCRVKVNVYDVFDGVPVRDLPWATFVLPFGARPAEGMVCPVQVGDTVWVEFIGGDTRRPIISGSALAMPEGKPTLAPDVWQGDGKFRHKRTPDQPPAEEPPYYEDVVACQNRALIQLCRSGAIRVTQMDSGSAIEIRPDGDMIIHCEGNAFTSVKGNVLEEVDGNIERRIKGSVTETISGSFEQTISGAMTQTSAGAASYGSSGASLALSAATQGSLTGGGGLAFEGPTTMKDDLTCGKNISAAGDIFAAGANSNHHSH